jgi:hypothetical protein
LHRLSDGRASRKAWPFLFASFVGNKAASAALQYDIGLNARLLFFPGMSFFERFQFIPRDER